MDLKKDSLSIIDGIPGLVAVLTSSGEFDTVNPQFSEYCGQSLEELRNWGTNGTIHPTTFRE
jgi:PAS domain-containing protein